MTAIAVLGSRPLSWRCLRLLAAHDSITIPAVVTYEPDHDGWWDGSLWEVATELGLNTVPIRNESELLDYDIDWLLSVQYPNIIGSELLDHPEMAPVNLHQAELPRYRGSYLFNHVLLNARDDDHWQHGTTLHFMTEAVDRGDIIDRTFVEITESDTARTLYDRTEDASVSLLESNLDSFVTGELLDMGTPQSAFDGPRYYYTREDIEGEKGIPPERFRDPAAETAVYDRIRAFDFPPFEPAYTTLDGETVYLTTAQHSDSRRAGADEEDDGQ